VGAKGAPAYLSRTRLVNGLTESTFSRRILMGGRLLDVVDDEDVNRAFRRFQSEPELFLECRKD
jgi:hypothetical protein